MIGLVTSAAGGAVQQAFLEECPEARVLSTEWTLDRSARELADVGASLIVPASPGAVEYAKALAARTGTPTLSVPASRSPLASLQGASRDLRTSAYTDEDETKASASGGTRYSVDMVTRDGFHAYAGAYELRVDIRDGKHYLRHRLSLPLEEAAASALVAQARRALDDLQVEIGATTFEMERSAAGTVLLDVLPAPSLTAMPADASFAAFGHSHQHLYAEAILRPRDFARRATRPLTPGRTTLGVGYVRNWHPEQARGWAGMRLVRRLTGFHSITPLQSGRSDQLAAVVSFVHPDRASVEYSLSILHEYEDSNAFFAHDDELIGFSLAAS
jgi:hypothetical protein